MAIRAPRRGYRKPVKTGKPGIADAIKPGSIDDLMQRYDATIRRAKKERQSNVMIDVTVGLYPDEMYAYTQFVKGIGAARKDPFVTVTPEIAKAAATLKFDELVPADDPPEATTGPTWAPREVPHVGSSFNKMDHASDSLLPTEDEAVEAFKTNAAKRTSDEWKALLTKYSAARVKDIAPARRAAFIAECTRDS